MGKRAASLLLKRLSGEASQGFQEIILPTEIIERQSSGPPID
jgi:DNA-binding LacI/PurR family transcriptional regulator